MNRKGLSNFPAWMLGVLLLLGGGAPPSLAAAPAPPLVGPGPYERQQIEAVALLAFQNIMSMWREELYFELYHLGMESTRERITREEFAQRMVELSWVPTGELNPKFLKTRFRFRTMVYVSARIVYRHKFNPGNVFFKDHTFLLLEEGGAWKIDLIQIIRAPFAT